MVLHRLEQTYKCALVIKFVKKRSINLIFIYIIFSAILLYYALKYGIRNGFVELEANKDGLVYYKKVRVYLKR